MSYSRGTAPDFAISDRMEVNVKTLTCNAYIIPDRFGVDGVYKNFFSSNSPLIRQWGILLGLMSVAYPNGAFHKGVDIKYIKMPKINAINYSELEKFRTSTTINGLVSGQASSTTKDILKEVTGKLGVRLGDVKGGLSGVTRITPDTGGYSGFKVKTWDQLGDNYIFKKYVNGTPMGGKDVKSIALPKATPEEVEYIKNAWNASNKLKKATPELQKLYRWTGIVSSLAVLFNIVGEKGIPVLTVQSGNPVFNVEGKQNVIFTAYAPLSDTAFEIQPGC